MYSLSRILTGMLPTLLFPAIALGQFGSQLTAVGPINRSMGGAATAAPLDTLGALQWNPATITALPSSADFGLELMRPETTLGSSVAAGSLAPGFPGADLAGDTPGTDNIFPLPQFGIVGSTPDSPWTYGLGVLSTGGFGVNYPGSPTNPILTPPLPAGIGVGPVFTQYQLMQVIPTLAVKLTDRLSLGFSPIVNLASLSVDPGLLAPPDNASGSGFPTYPPMTHGSFAWGAGFQVGAFYQSEQDWQLGLNLRSPQWFSDFEYQSRDQTGAPRNLEFGMDVPLILSLGTAWTGLERTLIAVDARYLNYSDTRGYSNGGFAPTGAVAGLGWDDVFAVSAGAQYLATDACSVRLGYSFNSNPISDDQAFFNAGAPLVIQHGAYLGTSYSLTQALKVSLSYAHFFENSISGPMYSPLGPIPGTSVTSHASADSLIFGVTMLF